MSILKAVVHWTALWQSQYQIPKGFLLVRYAPRYRKNVASALQKLDEYQRGKLKQDYTLQDFEDSLRPIDMTLDIHYKKRSLDANALMWSLYEIEANELNGYKKGADMETPQHIYEMDMKHFAPTMVIKIDRDSIPILQRNYSMIETMEADDQGVSMVKIHLTSSHWNSKEMHEHIEMIFDRLSMAGVELKVTADISHYWMEWRAALNEQKVVLHDDLYTIEEYRDLVKNCEACGCAVWHETVGASVAHIKAVGMGGHRVNKYHGSELMHLCDVDHAKFDNGKGRDVFLKEYPHLNYKVSTALLRDYDEEADHGDQLDIY